MTLIEGLLTALLMTIIVVQIVLVKRRWSNPELPEIPEDTKNGSVTITGGIPKDL